MSILKRIGCISVTHGRKKRLDLHSCDIFFCDRLQSAVCVIFFGRTCAKGRGRQMLVNGQLFTVWPLAFTVCVRVCSEAERRKKGEREKQAGFYLATLLMHCYNIVVAVLSSSLPSSSSLVHLFLFPLRPLLSTVVRLCKEFTFLFFYISF